MSKLIEITKTFIGECWHGKYDKSCIHDILSENCLHQKTIGKGVGIDSFLSDCYDWTRSFPDFSTKVQHVEEYKNVVITHIARSGTHLFPYKSTNKNKKTILSASEFFCGIEGLAPTGQRYEQPAKLIFAFDKGKISQLIIEEEPNAISRQLGLLISPSPPPDPHLDICLLEKSLSQGLGVCLSGREMDCLALAFCGFSAKHIGEILKISYRTVEAHFIHAYRKLDCNGKQEILEFMYEKNLLTLWLDLGKSLIAQFKNRGKNGPPMQLPH